MSRLSRPVICEPVPVSTGDPHAWRPWRFPELEQAAALIAQGDPADISRAVAQGFEQGQQQGYLEGLQEGRLAGQADGLRSGQELGMQQGRSAGRQLFEEAARPLERIGEQWQRYRAGFVEQRRDELLTLVGKVAQQVIRCELTLNPAQLLTLADEALAAMPLPPSEVHVLLSPEEHASIRDLAPERAQEWRLVADERLALGECRIVTPQAEIDIGCQQRLDACLHSLAEHLPGEE